VYIAFWLIKVMLYSVFTATFSVFRAILVTMRVLPPNGRSSPTNRKVVPDEITPAKCEKVDDAVPVKVVIEGPIGSMGIWGATYLLFLTTAIATLTVLVGGQKWLVEAPTKRMRSDLLWVTRWLTTIVVIEFWDCVTCAWILNAVPHWSCHFAWTILQWPAVEHILNQFRFNKPRWRPHDAFELIAFYAFACVCMNLAGVFGFARFAYEWVHHDYADASTYCEGRGGSSRRLQIYRGAMVDGWVARTQESCDDCMVRHGNCCAFYDEFDADNSTARKQFDSCAAPCWQGVGIAQGFLSEHDSIDGDLMIEKPEGWGVCAMIRRSMSNREDEYYLFINNTVFALLYLRVLVAALRTARELRRRGIEHIDTEHAPQEEQKAESPEDRGGVVQQHQPFDAREEIGDFPGKIVAERAESKWWCCLSPFGFGLFSKEAHGPDRIRQRGWIFCCFMAWVPFLEDRVRIGNTNRFRKAADPKDAGYTFLSARCACSGISVEAALC
jgi:membrane associated rhomboid family serine protease